MNDLCNDNRFELIEKYKKKLVEATNIETSPDEMAVLDNILFRFWQMGWLSEQPESTRTFVELVAKYPDPEVCTYKEYKGKPYYSIKFIENGETHVGYSTYSLEVLSRYLKDYFMQPSQSEWDEQFKHIEALERKVEELTTENEEMRMVIRSLTEYKDSWVKRCEKLNAEIDELRERNKMLRTQRNMTIKLLFCPPYSFAEIADELHIPASLVKEIVEEGK